MASKQKIFAALGRMATVYRHALNQDEIRILTTTWADALDDMPDDIFEQACGLHIKNCAWFPKPAEIRAAKDLLTPNRPPLVALPEDVGGPSTRIRDQINASMLRRSICGRDERAAAFFSQSLSWPEKEAIAREVLGREYPGSSATARTSRRDGTAAIHSVVEQGVRQ